MKPHSTIPGEQLDVLIYAILAFCCAVVLAGAAWIALDGAREGCCRCAPDDDLERASAAAAAEDEERERLIPEGYVDREGYGAVGIRVQTSLIRKAWTADGREVDYLSD